MKILLTTSSPDIDSTVDPRFGRAAYLLVVDSDTMDLQANANPGVNSSGGAGIQAAQFVVDNHAEAVISGDFGPHAFEALLAAGVSMYVYGDCRTASDAIQRFNASQLEQAGAPTRRGRRG